MKRILLLIVSLFTIYLGAFSQEGNELYDFHLVIEEDYRIYQPQFIEASDWLMNTPFGQDSRKREKVNAFVMRWLMGAPDVLIEVRPEVVDFNADNPELIIPFLIGWAKYSINNDYSKDVLQGNLEGIKMAIAFYEKNQSFVKKGKSIIKYKQLNNEAKLEKELKKRLKMK